MSRGVWFKALSERIPAGVITAMVTAAILWLTLAPHPLPADTVPMIPGMDKVVHACMFGSLYLAIAFDALRWREVKKREVRPYVGKSGAVLYSVVAIAFGGTIELVQGAMEMGRGCDVWDFVADAVGVVAAVLLAPVVLSYLRR